MSVANREVSTVSVGVEVSSTNINNSRLQSSCLCQGLPSRLSCVITSVPHPLPIQALLYLACSQTLPVNSECSVRLYFDFEIPFLFAERRLEMLYPTIRHKLAIALNNWHPSDLSAHKILEPWVQVYIDPSLCNFTDSTGFYCIS